jgi:hypothetical protein
MLHGIDGSSNQLVISGPGCPAPIMDNGVGNNTSIFKDYGMCTSTE